MPIIVRCVGCQFGDEFNIGNHIKTYYLNMKKKMAWFFSLSFAILPLLLGCSIFDSVARDNDGYYIKHLKSCGPEAIEKALIEYYKRKGIAYCVRADQISRQIQDKEQFLKKLLILFDESGLLRAK